MVYIIAECGVNWRTFEEAYQLIENCQEVGADAVKFQAFTIDIYEGWVLTKHDVNLLSQHAKNYNIDFIVTPMYPECVEWLAKYVDAFKIRYKDQRNLGIQQYIVQSEKKCYISTDRQLLNRDLFIPLYCQPEYPPHEVKLPSSVDFGEHSDWSGFSCHSPDPIVPLAAVARGAQYLEVHVMLDEYSDYWIPPDAAVSYPITRFRQLVHDIRRMEQIGEL